MTEKELNRLIKKTSIDSNKKELKSKKHNNFKLNTKSSMTKVSNNVSANTVNLISNTNYKKDLKKNRKSKKLRIKKIFLYITALVMLFFSIYLYNESLKQVICIDPGHGGHDTGAISNDNTRYEKDDNLNLALIVKDKLNDFLNQKEYKGKYKILLTRDSDEYLTLAERCKKANDSNAIIFVSLHRNSLPKSLGDAKGVEVWINNYENKIEVELANDILNEISNVPISENRGIKYGTMSNNGGNYFVNEHTNMKSVIVELGFISNDYDNSLYDRYINDYANAITNAIIKNIDLTSNVK